ncbi:hypothetical protein ACNIS2_25840, partial [Escherichia coli]
KKNAFSREKKNRSKKKLRGGRFPLSYPVPKIKHGKKKPGVFFFVPGGRESGEVDFKYFWLKG